MKNFTHFCYVTFLLLIGLGFSQKASAQVSGDFRSTTSGNWSTSTTWQRYNGTTWDASGAGSNNPGQTPTATSSVFIQTAHTVTLTANASCNDLHIASSTTSTPSATTLGKIALATFTLSVNGKMRNYYAALNILPGTSQNAGYNIYPFTGTTGKVSIVGTTRTVFASTEWGATISTPATGIFPLEINLNDNSQTATFASNTKSTSFALVTGIVSGATISMDNGTAGQGDASVASGTTLISSVTSANVFQRTGSTRAGTFTLDGTLRLTGTTPQISMNSIVLNGTVEYTNSGTQTLLGRDTDDASSVTVPTYNNLTLGGTNAKTLAVNTTVNGTLSMQGTASLALSSFTLTYGASSTLEYKGSATQNSSTTEFPATGVVNLIVNNSNGFRLQQSKTVTGNVTITSGDVQNSSGTATTLTMTGASPTLSVAGSITGTNVGAGNDINLTYTNTTGTLTISGAGTLCRFLNVTNTNTGSTIALGRTLEIMFGTFTENGILQMNSGGAISSVTNAVAPTYGASSKLVYNNTYNVGKEWTGNATTAGLGVPKDVTIQNSAAVTMPNGANLSRGLAGNLNITSGSLTLGNNSTDDDLYVAGNWTRASGTTFNPTTRAVFFNGTGTQTITTTGGETFDYLIVNKSSGTLQLGSDVTINGGKSITFTNGTITLSNFDFTLSSTATFGGNTSTKYFITNGTGQLKQTVSGSVIFPVGNSAYNPITLNNSGTSDVYGIRVVNGAVASANDANYAVNRSWYVTEGTAGGGNLSVIAQYNSGEEGSSFATGTALYLGLYNSGAWTQVAATTGGSITVTSGANFTNSLSAPSYFAVGKDIAFIGGCTPGAVSVSIAASPSGTICAGTVVTFTATPTNGGGAPSYQWKLNGSNVGTNSATYTSGTNLASGNTITCDITNAAMCTPTATSNTITMTVTPAPTTSVAGSNQVICVGNVATLAANTATVGTGAWTVSGPSSLTSQFSSTTSPTATFTPAGGAGTYTLTWTISNAPCTASTSSVTITVASGGATITTPPTNTTSCLGSTASLSVTANDVSNYVWRKRDTGWGSSGAWALTVGSGGFFRGASTGNGGGSSGIDTSSNSWGMYNTGGTATEAVRSFDAMSVGQVFQVDMDNGYVNTGGTIGFGLRNASNANMVEFYFNGGASSYTVNGSGVSPTPTIPYTANGLRVTLTVTSATTFSISVQGLNGGSSYGPFTGTFLNTGSITNFRAFDVSNLGGSNYDLFFNNLVVGGGNAAATLYDDNAAAYTGWSNGDNKGTSPLVNGATGNGSTISGAATSSLSIATAVAQDAGSYDVAVYNTCGGTTSSAVTLTLTTPPTVNAGTNITTCSDSGAVSIITGATAANTSGTTWSSSGTGTFSNASSISSCTYTPSGADITAGSVTLTLTANGNTGCSSVTSTKTLTIVKAPTAVAGSAIATCSTSGAVSIVTGASATNTSGTTWSTSGTGTFSDASSISASTYTPSGADITAGSVTITLTAATNAGCATPAVSTKTLTITPAPNAGTISGTLGICSNGTTTLASDGNGGGSWTSSATGVATVNISSGLVTGVAAGTTTITYTITGTGGCSNATATAVVTVTAAPNAGTLSGTQAICGTGTTTFTSNGTGGGSWTSSDTGVATVNISSGVITGVAAGTSTITYTVNGAGGCANATATRVVTVNALPTTAWASTATSVCQSSSLQTTPLAYASTSNSPTTYSITWNASPTNSFVTVTNATFSGTAGGGTINISVPANTNAGTYTGTITVRNASGCVSSPSQTFTVTVNPLPTAAWAATASSVCFNAGSSQNVTLAYSATTNTPTSYSISWSSVLSNIVNQTNTFTAANGAGTITIPIPANTPAGTYTGTITVKSANSCVSTATQTFTVTVNANPTASASNGGPYCEGGTVQLTGGPSNLSNYAWSGPNSYSVSGAGGVSINENFDGTVTGWSNTASTSTSTSSSCSGNYSLLFTGTSQYGITPAITNPQVLNCSYKTSSNAAAWSVNIQISDVTATSQTSGPWITVGTISAPTGNVTTCTPITAINLSAYTGTRYIKFVDTRSTGSAQRGIDDVVISSLAPTQSPTITNATTAMSGTYTLTTTNASGCTATATTTVTVNPKPAITAMTTTICSGVGFSSTPVDVTNGTVPSGTTYSWATPFVTGGLTGGASGSGASAVTGTLSNPTNTDQTATYTVTPTSGSGCAGSTFTVTVTVKPAPSSSVISGTVGICSGSSTNLQVTITGGASPYTVVYSGGTLNSYASGNNISVSPTSTTTYTLTSVTDANGCPGTGNGGSAVVSVITTTSTDGGATWDNGDPDSTKAIVFNGGVGTIGSDISGCTLRLTNNATVTVASGVDVDLSGAITIDSPSTFTLSNTANLIQHGTTNSNTGNITVNRDSSALKRLDYTLWSSPVTGQGLYAFSRFTLPNRFYVYDTDNNVYSNAVGFSLTGLQYPSPLVSPNGVDGTDSANVQFETGKGYLIRVPYDHPTTPTVYHGYFTGVPNSGDITVPVSLDGTPAIGDGFNAVGNPYPSRISVQDFIGHNTNTTGTLYFWRKTNNASTDSYASLTSIAYAVNTAPGGDTGTGYFDDGEENDWVLNIGQGFFVQATSGSTIEFLNTMRRSSNENQFFKAPPTTTNSVNGLYWLNLNSAAGSYSQMAVGYVPGGTLDFDRGIDGANINKEFYLTSLIGTGEYTIQGRPDFQSSDIVPLSYKATTAGTHTISIDHTSGLFNGGSQAIYLKDNLTNTEHNLQTGAYSFTSAVGTFNNRFEIHYESQLGVENPIFNENNVVVYSQNNGFVVNSGNFTMTSIKVFDIRGRLIEEKKDINANQTTIKGGLANGVLLVQITSEDGATVTKKVIK